MIKTKMVYAIARGEGHILRDQPCQDAVACFRENGASCIALSDGAGSIDDSQLASNTVAANAARELATNFEYWYALSESDFSRQMTAHLRNAVKLAFPETEPACTLLAISVNSDGRMLWCHIGDGVIMCDTSNGAITLSGPENGERLNLTYFISGEFAEEHLYSSRDVPDSATAFMLCSDGAAVSVWDPENAYCYPAVHKLCRMTEQLSESESEELLKEAIETVFRENTEDDMSVGIMTLGREEPRRDVDLPESDLLS